MNLASLKWFIIFVCIWWSRLGRMSNNTQIYNPISWQCKKQTLHSHSFGGAEYRAIATTASEIIGLLRLLHDLKVRCTSLVPFFCDNQIAIHIVAHWNRLSFYLATHSTYYSQNQFAILAWLVSWIVRKVGQFSDSYSHLNGGIRGILFIYLRGYST